MRWHVQDVCLILWKRGRTRRCGNERIALQQADGNVQLSDVSFSYNPEKEFLKDLNLSVWAGQKIAIVGPTGCGKTTLINLLMRFYEIDSGEMIGSGKNCRIYKRQFAGKFWNGSAGYMV